MMKNKVSFTIVAVLFILIVVLIVIVALTASKEASKAERAEVITDKKEYAVGDSLRVKIKNTLEEEICFSACYPYYLERKDKDWKSYDYQSCSDEDTVDSCVEPEGVKAFELVLPQIEKGLHRLAIPACIGCKGKKNFKDEKWFYSNNFIVK